jgi:hypothetical protein
MGNSLVKKSSGNSIYKIKPDPNYEKLMKHYLYNDFIFTFEKFIPKNNKLIIINDYLNCLKYEITTVLNFLTVYSFLRPQNENFLIGIGDKKTLDPIFIEYIILHELGHVIGGKPDTINFFDGKNENDLMQSPIHYYNLKTGKSNISLEKISLESIKRAYF